MLPLSCRTEVTWFRTSNGDPTSRRNLMVARLEGRVELTECSCTIKYIRRETINESNVFILVKDVVSIQIRNDKGTTALCFELCRNFIASVAVVCSRSTVISCYCRTHVLIEFNGSIHFTANPQNVLSLISSCNATWFCSF